MGKFKRKSRPGRMVGTGIFIDGKYHREREAANIILRKVGDKYKAGIRKRILQNTLEDKRTKKMSCKVFRDNSF